MIAIGITGTLGAGKGTIVEYLTENLDFAHYSVRNFLVQEITRRGMEVNRDTMTSMANEIRAKNSPSYIIDNLYNKALRGGKNCVIESIRTPGEVKSLKEKGNFYLIAIDADQKIRYERIRLRNSSTDRISFETFIANEKREMHSEDIHKQNLRYCINHADFFITNNGTREQLYKKVKNIIHKILQQ